MNFENLKKLKDDKFYRYFGIKRFHFDEMLEKLIKIENLEKTKGRKYKLSVEERLMLTLEYWKEYYTFFQMSIKYKMSASSCFRNITWVENKLSDDKDYQFLKTKYKSKIDSKIVKVSATKLFFYSNIRLVKDNLVFFWVFGLKTI